MTAARKAYDANSIQKLDFPENVRTRPTMYAGQIGHAGMMHLLREIADNSIDEALNGHARTVEIHINIDGSVSVMDDGRGIPVGLNETTGKNSLTMVFTDLHAGGKFEEGSYKISSGLNGVGAAVVNALSERLVVEVHRDGYHCSQTFERGVPVTEVVCEGGSTAHGTVVSFLPDVGILGEDMGAFDYREICHAYQERAFLNSGLAIKIADEASGKNKTYLYRNGLVDYVEHLAGGKGVLGDVIMLSGEEGGVSVDVAMTWQDSYDETTRLFCNTIKLGEGGTPLTGFRMALTKVVGDLVKTQHPKAPEASGEDCREGLVCIIAVKHPAPLYAGQHKSQLSNKDAQGITQKIVADGLQRYFDANPSKAKIVARKASDAAAARTAARKAREGVRAKQKDGFASLNGVSKLADCISSNPEECELFVVEGESAGGSAKNGRDKTVQAIFSLKGKPLNTEGVRPEALYGNKEMADFIQVVGTGVGADFDMSKLRYHKIIVMSDADCDGQHIATLLMGLSLRRMQPLIEAGKVYLASPPLYRVVEGRDSVRYLKDGRSMDGYLAERFASKGSVEFRNGTVEGEDCGVFYEASSAYLQAVQRLATSCACDPQMAAEAVETGEEDITAAFNAIMQNQAESRGSTVVGEWRDEYASAKAGPEQAALYRSAQQAAQPMAEMVEEAELPAAVRFGGRSVDAGTFYELREAMEQLARTGIQMSYLKGLGEMNPDQLWETTMDPANRTLVQLRVQDLDEAGETVHQLLGNEPALRRELMQESAHLFARETLDI